MLDRRSITGSDLSRDERNAVEKLHGGRDSDIPSCEGSYGRCSAKDLTADAQ